MAYLISKSRISSNVIVLVTSSNCRIFSSRFFFLSLPALLPLPSFWEPCSTLTNSPSFFKRNTSTALSRLNDGCRRFPITNVFQINNIRSDTDRKKKKKEEKKDDDEKTNEAKVVFVCAHFTSTRFYLIYCDKTVPAKSIELSNSNT